jgi:ribosomal protein S5
MVLFGSARVMFEAVRVTLLPAVTGLGLAVNEPTCAADGP